MSERFQLTLDGEEVSFTEDETLYEIAERQHKNIPTLCYDPRLEPFGACRLCVVEIEGVRNPVASCTTKATAGMVVHTATSTIEKHRKTLLEMVVSENREVEVDPLRGYASQELKTLVDRYSAQSGRFKGAQSGQVHATDDNPFILRDYDLCISCNRCVRVCAEQQADHDGIRPHFKRLVLHLLWTVRADLSDRSPGRQKSPARRRGRRRAKKDALGLPLLRRRLLRRFIDEG
jgi:predicted molibdopterin-dependent oxidoreductase YjgC